MTCDVLGKLTVVRTSRTSTECQRRCMNEVGADLDIAQIFPGHIENPLQLLRHYYYM